MSKGWIEENKFAIGEALTDVVLVVALREQLKRLVQKWPHEFVYVW